MGLELVTELQTAGVPAHQALKAAMSATNVRQFAVAELVGISEGQLSKLLAGRKALTDDMTAKIAAAIKSLAA